MDRFNSKEEIEFHPEALSQGRIARLSGFAMNDKASNPYIGFGSTHFMYRSFCAGWSDIDADPEAPKQQIRI